MPPSEDIAVISVEVIIIVLYSLTGCFSKGNTIIKSQISEPVYLIGGSA